MTELSSLDGQRLARQLKDDYRASLKLLMGLGIPKSSLKEFQERANAIILTASLYGLPLPDDTSQEHL